jgi:hypothetical protein
MAAVMSSVLAFDDEQRLSQRVRLVVEALRANGHKVQCSRYARGFWRFKLDDEMPWVWAQALSARCFHLHGLALVTVRVEVERR